MRIFVLGISHGIADYAQGYDNEGENILILMRNLSSDICGACHLRSFPRRAVIAGDDEDGDHVKLGATGLRMNSVSLCIQDWVMFTHLNLSQCKALIGHSTGQHFLSLFSD
jgi:hypothetical protein